MTETEWLACDDPARMLGFLRRKTSDRKLRLFACGCCRQLLPWNENSRVVEALARAERYADGELADGTIEKWNQEVNRIESALLRSMGGGGSAQTTICWAVSTVCLPKRYSGFLHVWESLAKHASLFGEEFSTKGPALVRVLMDDIFGNPFRPVSLNAEWLTSTVVALAEGIYEERAFDRMPILADALQDAGCTNEDVLNHCRDTSLTHVRGCWVVDLVLGKE